MLPQLIKEYVHSTYIPVTYRNYKVKTVWLFHTTISWYEEFIILVALSTIIINSCQAKLIAWFSFLPAYSLLSLPLPLLPKFLICNIHSNLNCWIIAASLNLCYCYANSYANFCWYYVRSKCIKQHENTEVHIYGFILIQDNYGEIWSIISSSLRYPHHIFRHTHDTNPHTLRLIFTNIAIFRIINHKTQYTV